MDWHEQWEPLTSEELESLRKDLGVSALPDDYEEFLLTEHGEAPVLCDIDVHVPELGLLETSINFLNGREGGPGSVRWTQKRTYEGELADCIPFASDGGGNVFCLEVTDFTVTFFYHGATAPARHFLAASFKELVGELKKPED